MVYDITREAWLRNQQRFQEAALGNWHWPLLDVANYGRQSGLAAEELAALRELAAHFDATSSRKAYQQVRAATPGPTALTRVVEPLCDALDITGATKSRRHMTLRVLLLEVQRRQQAYWAWTRDDWIEIICPDAERFWERHHVARGCRQQVIAVAYLLGDCAELPAILVDHVALATMIFGKSCVEAATRRVEEGLARQEASPVPLLVRLLCQALLTNHDPRLESLSYERLRDLYQGDLPPEWRRELVRFSSRLAQIGVIERTLPFGIHVEWARWCQRWYERSTIEARTRRGYYLHLLRVGRWLAQYDPSVHSPAQWTAALTAAFVRAVDRLEAGQWSLKKRFVQDGARVLAGEQMKAATKTNYFMMLQTFFRDCSRWGWFDVAYDVEKLPWAKEGAAAGAQTALHDS